MNYKLFRKPKVNYHDYHKYFALNFTLMKMRSRLSDVLSNRPQFPDVVGDRKLLRFLRGHDHSVDKACEMFTKFLKWRDENGVDEIRERIVHGGLNHPKKFPNGEKVWCSTYYLSTSKLQALDSLTYTHIISQCINVGILFSTQYLQS